MPETADMTTGRLRVGLDLGGTKIEGVALGTDGAVVARERVSAPIDNYRETIKALGDVVRAVEGTAGRQSAGLGIGTPGWLDPATGLMTNANQTSLNGQRLDADLSAETDRPVKVMNDANCFALAEARAGAGQGAGVVFGAILGTGVGGGIVVDGRPLTGRNMLVGEWGHNPLPGATADEIPGPLCYCGHKGCIERWCSGPGLADDHLRRTGADMDARMIASFADAGDMDARETIDLHVSRLARALGSIVNIVDPDVIVLGGGLSNLDHLYTRLPDAMEPHVFAHAFDTPIVRNRLGDSAGVVGAAWLWPV